MEQFLIFVFVAAAWVVLVGAIRLLMARFEMFYRKPWKPWKPPRWQ